MEDIQKYTRQNRQAWDEIAEERHNEKFPPAAFFAQGGSVLDSKVLKAAGDVTGKSVLHLQCSAGSDTISWAVAGAKATGVDISERQIEIAQRTADETGLPVRFIAADIYALPDQLLRAEFDVVFTGGGAIVWLPALDPWARTIAAALRPGGRLILSEEHPVAGCLWVSEGELVAGWVDDEGRVVGNDYFARHKPFVDTGWSHFEGGATAKEEKYEFAWPLGDVITALAQAGLCIERLEEYPSQAEWRYGDKLEEVARLPGEYLLIARKP